MSDDQHWYTWLLESADSGACIMMALWDDAAWAMINSKFPYELISDTCSGKVLFACKRPTEISGNKFQTVNAIQIFSQRSSCIVFATKVIFQTSRPKINQCKIPACDFKCKKVMIKSYNSFLWKKL